MIETIIIQQSIKNIDSQSYFYFFDKIEAYINALKTKTHENNTVQPYSIDFYFS